MLGKWLLFFLGAKTELVVLFLVVVVVETTVFVVEVVVVAVAEVNLGVLCFIQGGGRVVDRSLEKTGAGVVVLNRLEKVGDRGAELGVVLGGVGFLDGGDRGVVDLVPLGVVFDLDSTTSMALSSSLNLGAPSSLGLGTNSFLGLVSGAGSPEEEAGRVRAVVGLNGTDALKLSADVTRAAPPERELLLTWERRGEEEGGARERGTEEEEGFGDMESDGVGDGDGEEDGTEGDAGVTRARRNGFAGLTMSLWMGGKVATVAAGAAGPSCRRCAASGRSRWLNLARFDHGRPAFRWLKGALGLTECQEVKEAACLRSFAPPPPPPKSLPMSERLSRL